MGRAGYLLLITPFSHPWKSRAANQDKMACSYYLSADLVSHVGLTVKSHVPIWRFIKCFEYLLITWASTLTVTKQFSRYPTLCKPYIPHWSLLWERVRWHKAPRVVNISWVEPVLHHWAEHVPSLDLSLFIRGCIDSALKTTSAVGSEHLLGLNSSRLPCWFLHEMRKECGSIAQWKVRFIHPTPNHNPKTVSASLSERRLVRWKGDL